MRPHCRTPDGQHPHGAGVDDGPLHFRHGLPAPDMAASRSTAAAELEQAVGTARSTHGASGDVGQVSALRIYFVEVCIQRHGDEG